jgi:hypothetical protein
MTWKEKADAEFYEKVVTACEVKACTNCTWSNMSATDGEGECSIPMPLWIANGLNRKVTAENRGCATYHLAQYKL